MGWTRNIGLIGVPIEQVKGPRLFAHHVIVDDIAPDQIGGAEPVKRLAHHFAGHDAVIFFDDFIDLLQAFFAGEDFQLTCKIEI